MCHIQKRFKVTNLLVENGDGGDPAYFLSYVFQQIFWERGFLTSL